jgi:large subunit ribosomal protein L21
MYAVIKTGGQQYRVATGDLIRVAKLPAEPGAEIVLDQVLILGGGDTVRIGSPVLAGAAVQATVVGHGRLEKISIFKLRRRKHSKRTQGHRQHYTEIKITGISG